MGSSNTSVRRMIMLACLGTALTVSVVSVLSLRTLDEGEALAKVHCASCHEFPAPYLLPKSNWVNDVLPLMALHLGVVSPPDTTKKMENRFMQLKADGHYPDYAIITMEEWNKINRFYEREAPIALHSDRAVYKTTNQFKIRAIHWPSTNVPSVTALHIDSLNKTMYVADDGSKMIYQLTGRGDLLNSFPANSTISHLYSNLDDQSIFATHIGFSIQPTESKVGYIEKISLDKNKGFLSRRTFLSELYRPVEAAFADFDNDGSDEMVTNNFGGIGGSLMVWNLKGDSWHSIYTYSSAGPVHSVIADLNADGKKDILTLFAQGDERIVWFENKGTLNFEARPLLRFPPVYGSSYFDLLDFNGDGFLDIIYVCGDNADYSMILKPYHGIYIYINTGNDFRLKHFLPLHGAYKAIIRDFDLDGDKDIAAVAFFADFEKEADAGFVYFENDANASFTPYTVSGLGLRGRWISLEAGDFDGDGYEDLVLANYASAQPFFKALPSWRTNGGVTLLMNQGRINAVNP